MRSDLYDPDADEYLDSIAPEDAAAIDNQIDQLKKISNPFNWPPKWVEKVEGDLWSLRFGDHRLFFYFTHDKIVFVDGFRKRWQSYPRHLIRKGLKRISQHQASMKSE